MNAQEIGGRMCGMRVRRVGYYQTLETAVRGIGASFRGSGRQELSPRSDENPIYAAISRTLFHRAGKKQWERCLKGHVGEIKALLWWHHDEWRDLWNLSFSLSCPIVGDLFVFPAFRRQEQSTLGNPSTSRINTISMSFLFGARSLVLSRNFAAFARHREKIASCYYSHLRCERAMNRRILWSSIIRECSSIYRILWFDKNISVYR